MALVTEMQGVEMRILWERVIAQAPVAAGPYGTTYHVPDLGDVWIEPDMAEEAAMHSGEEICILVSPQKNQTPHRLWLLAGFVTPLT